MQFFSCAAFRFIFYSFEMTSLVTILSYYSSEAFERRLTRRVWKRSLFWSFAWHSAAFRFLRLKYLERSKLRSKTSLMSAPASISFLPLESVVMEWTSVCLALREDCGRWLIELFGFPYLSSPSLSASWLDRSRLTCVGVPLSLPLILLRLCSICLIFSCTRWFLPSSPSIKII
jgi:hypothetical protein